ncbi:MAG TPA: DUF3160 domain-containing protein [Labilithrix sp.]|nr:DUF3160 domain-containing protein [Labilithrix sp.]
MAHRRGGIEALGCALAALLTLASCAHDRPRTAPGPLQALPEPRRTQRLEAAPEWYWEPVELDGRSAPKPLELPVAESSVVRMEGAVRVWNDLGAAGRERLGRDGLVVLASGGDPRLKMGAFYSDLREQRVPYVVTLDALAYALHVAFERALAEVDDTLLAPGLDALLVQLETRLAAEQKGAGVELGEALGLARGMVAVARGLAAPEGVIATARSSTGAREDVGAEIARVLAHAGVANSPLLGAPIDYGRFVVPAAAARPGSYRALAWLASAPLLFVAESEDRGAAVGVATSRLHTRAAMVLSRLTLREVDPAIHALWTRIRRVLTFVWGPSDDLTPPELAEMGSSIAIAVEDPKQVPNVVTVDRLRKRAAHGRAALVFDGSGAPGRSGAGLRLFGGHAPADSVALASLAGPSVGRALPSVLDLPAWIGAREGRAARAESGLDGASGYDAALARAITTRPGESSPSRHASVHGSLLDVVMTWLAPDAPRTHGSAAGQRAAIESAMAVWTFARHDGEPLSRSLPPRAAPPAKALEIRGAPLAAFVEAAPDVLAQLVATVMQMKRGLAVVGGLPATSPSMIALAEVEDLLRVALRLAEREVNDEALTPEDTSALASLPARLSRLEEATGSLVPVVAELFVDAAGDRTLSTATGPIEPAVTLVREPGTGRLVLAVGAHLSQHELVEPRAARTTDVSWRERIVRQDSAAPARAPYTAAFRARP